MISKLKLNSKCISPVVATSLLLVVAVTSVVFFQGWFNTFSSSVLVDVDEQTNLGVDVKVEGVFNDELYLNSNNDVELDLLVVKDDLGNEVCSFDNNLNSSIDLSSNLIGHWKFDDNSSVISDYSGNGNDGVLYGSTKLLLNFDGGSLNDLSGYNNSLQAGSNTVLMNSGCKSGECFNYTGNAYIYSGRVLDLPYGNSSRTACSWVNMDNSSFSGNILSYGSGINTSERFSILVSNGQIGVIGQGNDFKYHGNLTPNTWQFVCATYDSSIIRIFIDGQMIAESSHFDLNTSSTHHFRVGKNTDDRADEYFKGMIDEVSIYSKALSKSEILDLYNFGKVKFIEFKKEYIEFDGIDDFIEINSNLGISNNFTVFAKILSNKYGNGRQSIISADNEPLEFAFEIGTIGGGFNQRDTVFANSLSNTIVASLVNDSFSYNKKTSLVYTKNLGLNKIYYNGVIQSLDNDRATTFTDSTKYFIGKRNTGFQQFKGNIYEIRVYNRVLNDTEIRFLSTPSLELNSNNLNKLDLSSCNLEKGKRYDILTGSSDGLSEVSVIVK